MTPVLEFVDQDTLVFLDAATATTGAPGTDVRVKALKRVSTSPGAATWTPGSEEGGFNFSSSTESWESVLLGELGLDFGLSESNIGVTGNADTAMVVNQDGVTGMWVIEDDGVGDDLAFFQITNFSGTSGNGLREFNIEYVPGSFLNTLGADQNPSVDPSTNDGDSKRVLVDANGNVILIESGFYDTPQHEPTVQKLNILSMDDGNGRIELGAWDPNIVMDTTGLTDDDGAVVTDERMSVLDTVNNILYVYDSDNPTDGGSYDQDWYAIDLNTGLTSFIAQDVDNIISYSFGDDTSEFFFLGGTLLEGDLNGDGFVGLADLDIVLGNWNQTVPTGDLLAGDPTGDGYVGLGDLDIVLGNWNAGTPPTPAGSEIPEPASLALFTIAGLSTLARRRSQG